MGEEGRLSKAWKRAGGTGRLELSHVSCGDIVSIAGAGGAGLADTVGGVGVPGPLEPGPVDPPTLRCAGALLELDLGPRFPREQSRLMYISSCFGHIQLLSGLVGGWLARVSGSGPPLGCEAAAPVVQCVYMSCRPL